MIKLNYLLCILFILPGCVGPTYKRPKHIMPEHFATICDASEAEPILNWWEQFNDKILNELIEEAINNNYDLLIALEKIEESRAQYQFREAQLLPEIDIISQARRSRFSKDIEETSVLPKSTISFFQFGLDAFWEIDIWGRIRHAYKGQYFAFEAQIEQMHDVMIMLIAEVTQRYIELCALKQKILLTEEKINIELQLVVLQKDLYKSGLASEIEVTKREQLLATDQDQLEKLFIAHTQTQNKLAILLGQNPEKIGTNSMRSSVPLSEYQLHTGIPSDLLRRRPDIRQAERLVASANEFVGVAVADWFPRFTLLGGLTTESNKGNNLFSNNALSWYIGPSIRWPLINFGRIKATIQVEESRNRQAILAYSNTIINALKDVEDFLSAYCHTKESVGILTYKYLNAQIEETLTHDRFQSGLANKLVYLETFLNRLNISLELVDVQQAFSSSIVSLYKALGGGW